MRSTKNKVIGSFGSICAQKFKQSPDLKSVKLSLNRTSSHQVWFSPTAGRLVGSQFCPRSCPLVLPSSPAWPGHMYSCRIPYLVSVPNLKLNGHLHSFTPPLSCTPLFSPSRMFPIVTSCSIPHHLHSWIVDPLSSPIPLLLQSSPHGRCLV